VLPKLRRQIKAASLPGAPWGRRVLTPYSGGRQPLALEATLERWIPGRPFSREDIRVWERHEPALNLLVLFDTSLSMSGPGRITAAVAAAILAREAALGKIALLAFHAEVDTVIRFGERIRPMEAAYRVLKLPMGGITDLDAVMKKGLRMLAGNPGHKTQTVLITDAERTAGPDPSEVASRYSGLNVVLIGGRNVESAKQLAHLGKGRFRQVESLTALPSVLFGLLVKLAGQA
jgi:Mg-chelatase subunit ChlD